MALHEKCNLSLDRFTKIECAEPNRLFMNPKLTSNQRGFASSVLVSSMQSETKKGLNIQVNGGEGKNREGDERWSFDYYETTPEDLEELKDARSLEEKLYQTQTAY